ncbi:MAG: hypothetical protein J5685_00695 [Clostridiales bacterium]|nr:hypothetical protein [Clostridiales bacterium]
MKFVIKISLIVFAVLSVIGYLIYNDAYNNKRKISCHAETTGEIIEFKDPIYFPSVKRSRPANSIVAKFVVNGVTYECRGKVYKWKSRGDEIKVYYDPTDPSLAYCGDGPQSKLSGKVVGITSAISGLTGVAYRPAGGGWRKRDYLAPYTK